jgi:hypothetical protein
MFASSDVSISLSTFHCVAFWMSMVDFARHFDEIYVGQWKKDSDAE